MRRLNLALLATFQLCAARSPGFSVHDDLLAYPQYEIVFSDNYITEKDAEILLEKSNEHPTYSADFSQATATTEDASTANADSSTHNEDAPTHAYELINMFPHKYLCSIPILEPSGPENETANALARAEEERERNRAALKGWELVNELEDTCLYYVAGWWSYSFCNNREIVQFHAAPSTPNGQPPRRDPNSQEYVLGRVPTLPATTNKQKKQRNTDEPVKAPAELQVKGDQRFLVQRLEGGTVCDLTGRDRTIEVQYQCVPGMKNDKIGWIKEVAICTYIMMVNTPRLCDDVAFQPPVERKANPINCQLVSDTGDNTRPLLDAEKISKENNAGSVPEKETKEGETADPEQVKEEEVTVGGIVVGARRVLSAGDKEGKPPVKLGHSDFRKLTTWGARTFEVIVKAASKKDGGEVQQLSPQEIEDLEIDRETLREMQEELKKLAGDSGWKIDLVELGNGQERELRGYVDDDEDEVDDKKVPGEDQATKKKENKKTKGGQKAGKSKEKEKDSKKDEEGSEEKFFKEEL